MRVRLIFNPFMAVLAIGLMSDGVVAAQTPPEHIEAYVKSIKAEQAEQEGDLDASLSLYKESLQLYQAVSEQYPQWRPDIVQYRITQTANQIERIQKAKRAVKKADDVTAAARQENVVPPPDPVLQEQRDAWLKEKESLTAALQQQADEFGRRQESWDKEKRELISRYEELAARPDESEIPAALPDPSRWLDAMAVLSNRIAVLEIKVQDVPDTPSDYGGNRPARVEQMAEQISALKETIDLNKADMAKVRAFKSTIKSLEKENKVLKKQVEEMMESLNVPAEK